VVPQKIPLHDVIIAEIIPLCVRDIKLNLFYKKIEFTNIIINRTNVFIII